MPTLLEYDMATGIPSRVSAPAFHGDDVEQSGEYRTLSVLAIISLIFGLASPLCFAGPLLMAIPIFGIAVSILALQRIAVSDGVLAGRWAAICGLTLCVIFTIAPFSRDFVLRKLRSQQAEGFGRNWITLILSGHSDAAFRLTVEGARPAASPEPGQPPPKTTPFETFLGQTPVKSLAAAGAAAQVRFDGTLAYDRQSSRSVYVRQQFEVIPSTKEDSANSTAHPVDVVLNVRRAQLPGEGRSRWLVSTIETASTAAPTHE